MSFAVMQRQSPLEFMTHSRKFILKWYEFSFILKCEVRAGRNQTGLFTFKSLLASEQRRHRSDCAYHGSRRSSVYI